MLARLRSVFSKSASPVESEALTSAPKVFSLIAWGENIDGQLGSIY